MPINLREFTQAMNEWMPQAPPEAREHLRPSTWKQLLRTGEDVAAAPDSHPRRSWSECSRGGRICP